MAENTASSDVPVVTNNSSIEEDNSESDFSSDDDSLSLSASKVPTYKPSVHNINNLQKPGNMANTHKNVPIPPYEDEDSEDHQDDEYSEEDSDYARDDEERAVHETKTHFANTFADTPKRGEKPNNRKTVSEIHAVQPMPKAKSLKKHRGARVPQEPTAINWKLPLYADQPFPVSRADSDKKKRKREDPAKFLLQLTASFAGGTCQTDECVFEDARGIPVSDLVSRKFTPRKILRSLCKQLWNTVHYGVLTNARRRSLYESNTFEKKLRERGASAALLGGAVETLASNYHLLDFVHIWFTDGNEEIGLRLSAESYRIATQPPTCPTPKLFPKLAAKAAPTQSTVAAPQLKKQIESTTSVAPPRAPLPNTASQVTQPLVRPLPRPAIPFLPQAQAQFPLRQTPLTQAYPQQSTPLDSAMILAKILHDDKMRARIFTDSTLLFDICCSLGLEKRPEDPTKVATATPTTALTTTSTASTTALSGTTEKALTSATTTAVPAPTATTPISTTPATPPPTTSTPTTPTPTPPATPSNHPSVPTVISPSTPIPTTPPTVATQPIVPIYASTPDTGSLQTSSNAAPTLKLDSPSRGTGTDTASPKLTITLAPKSPLAPSAVTAPASPTSGPATRLRKRGGRQTPEGQTTRRFHKRRKETPPTSPSSPTEVVDIKQEDADGEIQRAKNTNNVPASEKSDSTGPSLKFAVESIDLDNNEEEKVTLVLTEKDGKTKRRMYMTVAEISLAFAPETAKYYLDEVTKFREGTGNSAYRSALRRRKDA